MDPQNVGAALMRLPDNAWVEQVDLYKGTVTVHYGGVSKQEVERAGWKHVDSTDYYGVAEYYVNGDSNAGTFGLGGTF